MSQDKVLPLELGNILSLAQWEFGKGEKRGKVKLLAWIMKLKTEGAEFLDAPEGMGL